MKNSFGKSIITTSLSITARKDLADPAQTTRVMTIMLADEIEPVPPESRAILRNACGDSDTAIKT